MPIEKDEEFIIDVLNFVKENPGSNANEIFKVLEQNWPGKKKSNVNSALYQLKSKSRGDLDSDDNGGAPSWYPSDSPPQRPGGANPLDDLL